MSGSIHIGGRLASVVLIVGAMATFAQFAQSDPGLTRSPDAIERALAAEQAQRIAAIDTRERRAPLERPTLAGGRGSGPDGFERALITHADVGSPTASMRDGSFDRSAYAIDRAREARQTMAGPPDAFERALSTQANGHTESVGAPVADSPTVSSGGFDWSDFGIGAGTGMGITLLLIGLGAGVLTLRQSHKPVSRA
jgi:hypothetical protein